MASILVFLFEVAVQRRLDSTTFNMQWDQLAQIAQDVIDETLTELPDEIKGHAERIPVSLESSPSQDMEEDVSEDTLGLFVGEPLQDAGLSTSPMPGQILLFLENIWDFAEQNQDDYREEVRVTFLRELGHYFGWDEEDLFNRDLD